MGVIVDTLEQVRLSTYKQIVITTLLTVSRHIQAVKDWNKAEALIRSLEKSNIEPYELFSVKANYFRKQGDYDKAFENITAAYQSKPTFQVIRNAGIIALLKGEYRSAIAYLEEALVIAKNDFWALKAHGDISLVNGAPGKAIQSYTELLSETPNDSTLLSNLSIAQSLLGQFIESNSSAKKAYELNPNNIDIILNLADSYSYINKTLQAHEAYNKIISLTDMTSSKDELIVRVQALLHTGKKVRALQLLDKLEKSDSNIYDLLFVRALVLTRLGEHQSAMLSINSAIQNGWSKSFYTLPWFQPLCEYSSQLERVIGTKNMNQLCTYK